jgi:hypothetical protein
MRLFQLIALPFIAVMVIVSVRNLIKNRARLLAALFWVLLWVAILIAVAYPDTTTQLARRLGIYRGADLLVYSAVMAFSVGFYVVSLRLRQQSREITVLTRELALLEAERKNDHASPRG